MKETATDAQIQTVAEKLEQTGFAVHKVVGVHRTILGAIGEKFGIDIRSF